MVPRLIGAEFITGSSHTVYLKGVSKMFSTAAVLYPSYPGCWDQPLLPQGPGSLEEDWLLGELR